jgi:hypothetical protein
MFSIATKIPIEIATSKVKSKYGGECTRITGAVDLDGSIPLLIFVRY